MHHNSYCYQCGLWATCNHPCMGLAGDPDAKFMFITEIISDNDDSLGRILPGQRISNIMDAVNIPYNMCSAVKCRSIDMKPDDKGNPKIYNREPSAKEVKACTNKTVEILLKHKPQVVVLLGEVPVQQLLGINVPLKMLHGRPHYHPVFNCWMVPTYHPSFMSLTNDRLLDKLFREDLKVAVELYRQPKVRTPLAQPKTLKDPTDISNYLDELYEKKLYSVDLETTGLNEKVDRITDISFCHTSGQGRHIKWTDMLPHFEKLKKVLEDPQSKQIYQNGKFDKKFLRRIGINVVPIYFDTMLASHTMTMAYEGSGAQGYSLEALSWLYTKEGDYKSILEQFGGISGYQQQSTAPTDTQTSTGSTLPLSKTVQIKNQISNKKKIQKTVVRTSTEETSLFDLTEYEELPDHINERLGHIQAAPKETSILDNFKPETKPTSTSFKEPAKPKIKSVVTKSKTIEEKIIYPWETEIKHKQANLQINKECDATAILHTHYVANELKSKVEKLQLTPLEFYSAMDADVTLQIQQKLSPIIDKEYKWVFYNLIMPLTDTLIRMEENGVRMDQDQMTLIAETNLKEIETIKQKLYKDIGYEFNINSTKDLYKVMYEDLKIPPHPKYMTKGGKSGKKKPSSDKNAIEFLSKKYPQLLPIVRFRTLEKQNSTYVEGFRKLIDPYTGRIYGTFWQTTTATGRLSSANPNLQNIPRENRMRNMFVPSLGNKFVTCDLSQAELRVLAMMSNDKKMLEAFASGHDFHMYTACMMFNIPLQSFDKKIKQHADARSAAKAINFGIAYQMGAPSLAEDLGISLDEAQNFIDKFYLSYPSVKRWVLETQDFVLKHGYVETLHGRRRYLPEVWSSKDDRRERALRQAVNTPIQGTASDCACIGLMRLQNYIDEHNLKSMPVMIVHDEIIVDTPENEVDIIMEKLPLFMTTDIPKMSINLEADPSVMDKWQKE